MINIKYAVILRESVPFVILRESAGRPKDLKILHFTQNDRII